MIKDNRCAYGSEEHDYQKVQKIEREYDSFYGRLDSETIVEAMICRKCGNIIKLK